MPRNNAVPNPVHSPGFARCPVAFWLMHARAVQVKVIEGDYCK